jgi:hypothetical protein
MSTSPSTCIVKAPSSHLIAKLIFFNANKSPIRSRSGPGSWRAKLIRIHADSDPKHWYCLNRREDRFASKNGSYKCGTTLDIFFIKQQKINTGCISTVSIKIAIFFRQLLTISRKTDITTVPY